MASIDRADPVIMGHLLAQHRELHDLLVETRAAFLGSPGGPPAVATARDRLTALRDYLARHFAQEEEGGYLEESLARLPRLSGAVREVLAEHPGLLGELDGLLERLAARDSEGEAWRQAGRDFEAFASHLLAHERNENAVLEEGYNEDLGLAD
jgi:hypothetical protein